MKNSLTNPVKYNKIIIIEAILLTIVIHILFFVIFSVPEVRQKNTASGNTTVTLLRFGNQDNGGIQMKNFISKYNPGHFSNPRSPLGYASFRSIYSPQPFKTVRLADDSLQIKSAALQKDFTLPQNNVKNIPLPQKDILQIKPNSTVRLAYPFAVSSSGVIIPLTFSTDEQRMINEFPLSAGVFKVFKSADGGMMRFAMLKSCGRRALDRLSIKGLQQEINKLANCSDGEIFTVYYREPENSGDGL